MLQMFKKVGFFPILLLVLGTFLVSYTPPAGGEGFEIYLNNKLVMQRFGSQLNTVQELQLDQHNVNDQLVVKYYHCGRVGKDRMLTIKNDEEKIIKQWRFSNTAPQGGMCCSVKEILSLEKIKAEKLNLYYASSELPNGRLLASLQFTQKAVASR